MCENRVFNGTNYMLIHIYKTDAGKIVKEYIRNNKIKIKKDGVQTI